MKTLKKLACMTMIGLMSFSLYAQDLDLEPYAASAPVQNDRIDVNGQFSRPAPPPRRVTAVDRMKRIRERIERKNEEMVRKRMEKKRFEMEITMMKKLINMMEENFKKMDQALSK